jgi:hypothetical protein
MISITFPDETYSQILAYCIILVGAVVGGIRYHQFAAHSALSYWGIDQARSNEYHTDVLACHADLRDTRTDWHCGFIRACILSRTSLPPSQILI